MKKVAIILTAAVTTALLSSCAKTYTCECTETTTVKDNNGTVSTYTEKYSYTYHAKKKYSDEACTGLVNAKGSEQTSANFQGSVEEFGGSIECQSK